MRLLILSAFLGTTLVSGCAEKNTINENGVWYIECARMNKELLKCKEDRCCKDLGATIGALEGAFVGASAFDPNYQPVSLTLTENKSAEEILSLLENIFHSKGYGFTKNEIFLTLTTDPKDLGYQDWLKKHEKWKIKYRVKIQLIRGIKPFLYWDLSGSVVGERSGHEDREFSPEDFILTEKIFEELNREIVNQLSRSS